MNTEERNAFILIVISLTVGELILWGLSHNWFDSTFWFANAIVAVILAALCFAAGVLTLKDESN